jgi:hypothetical protein
MEIVAGGIDPPQKAAPRTERQQRGILQRILRWSGVQRGRVEAHRLIVGDIHFVADFKDHRGGAASERSLHDVAHELLGITLVAIHSRLGPGFGRSVSHEALRQIGPNGHMGGQAVLDRPIDLLRQQVPFAGVDRNEIAVGIKIAIDIPPQNAHALHADIGDGRDQRVDTAVLWGVGVLENVLHGRQIVAATLGDRSGRIDHDR